jgi:hypothetical protein
MSFVKCEEMNHFDFLGTDELLNVYEIDIKKYGVVVLAGFM